MIPYADTSFIISLLVARDNSQQAREWWNRHDQTPLVLSCFTDYEFRVKAHKVWLESQSRGEAASRRYYQHTYMRHFIVYDIDFRDIVVEATRILDHDMKPNRLTGGSVDVLHLATARLLGADTFLSFDNELCGVAAALGFAVHP